MSGDQARDGLEPCPRDELVERWNGITDDALTMANDWLANPTEEEAAWAIAQLVAWPDRIDPERTTNDQFLRMSVAALALRQKERIEADQSSLDTRAGRIEALEEALEALTHYAECQVARFSGGSAYLDMTGFPHLCGNARAALRGEQP